MAQYVPLPDGNSVKVREGETPDQAWERAQRMYPESFGGRKEAAPKQDTTGFKAAAAAGLERLGGEFELLKGKTGLKDTAAAQKEYEAAQKRAEARFTPTEEGWTESPWLKFKETLGGSVPYMAAPAAAGLAALAAPVSVPVAAGLGLVGAGLTSAGQFTGSNLARQMDTGKTLEQTDLGSAVGAAVPQALIDTAAMALLPGVGKLFGSVGSKLTTEQARAIASQTLGKAAMDYTAKTGAAMTREGLTEATQQALERLQAGLSITDPEARKEYIDSFVGGAVLGSSLAPAGRYIERSGAKSQAAKADRADRLKAEADTAEQERIAAEEDAAEKQKPEYALQVAKQLTTLEQEKLGLKAQIRKITKDSATEAEDKAFNKEINQKLRVNQLARDELAPEVNRLKQSGVYQQALEQERVAGLSPMDYLLENTKEVSTRKPTAAVEDTTYEDSGLAFQSPLVPSVERRKAEEAEKARVAALPAAYAAERVELARTQLYDPTGDDYLEYLLQDPYKASLVVENRTPLPGLTSNESNMLRNNLAKRLKAMGKEELTSRQADLQAQKPGKEAANPMAQFLADQDMLDVARQEGFTEADIAFVERQAAMPREVIQQGDLFGEQRVGQAAGVTEQRGNIADKLDEMQRQLDIAYAQRNTERGGQYRETIRGLIEQIRDLQRRTALPTEGELGTATADLQGQLGQLPESLQAQQDAQAQRRAALARLANKDADARADVLSGLVGEITAARGALRPETITEIEKKAEGILATVERYGAQDGVLADVGMRLDRLSQKWRGGTERGETATRTATPTTTTAAMLRDQMDRAFAQNDMSTRTERRERYAPQDMAVLNRIADNFVAFAVNPDRLNMAGEWLNRLTTTGRSSPEMTRDLQAELARLEEGKQQENGQLDLPERFMPKEIEGKAPAKKSTAFATAAEFQKYLASDALKLVRQSLGLGKDTASRMHARLELFSKKVENISKQLASLETRKQALQEQRKTDTGTAIELLRTAEENLKKIYDRLDAELLDLQTEYMQARQQFDFTAQTVSDIGQKIADNLAAFQGTDTAVAESAQNTADAKTAYAAAIEQPVTKRTFSALRKARREVITAIEKQITASRKAGADDTILAFLNADLNLQMQMQAEEKTLDQDALALFDAGMALEYASAAQKRSRKNQKELKQAQQELAAALEIKGTVAAEAADTDTQLAQVERDIAAAEKELNRVQGIADNRETSRQAEAATRAEQESKSAFEQKLAEIKIEPLTRSEQDAIAARDKAKLDAFQSMTARLAAIPGTRIDFTKRQQMLESFNAHADQEAQLTQDLKDVDTAIEEMQIAREIATDVLADMPQMFTPEQIAKFQERIKTANERIEQLTAYGKLLEAQKANMQKAYEKAVLATSSDPEIYQQVTKDLDARVEKLNKDIAENEERIAKGKAKSGKKAETKTLAQARKRVANYKRELKRVEALRSNRLGIQRTDAVTGAPIGKARRAVASPEQQELRDAEIQRLQEYGREKDRLSTMEAQLAALKAAKEPRGKAKQEERKEKIRELQEKVNKQQAEVNLLAPRAVGTVSQATRVQSSAPGKLRTGTQESKEAAGIAKQPITEKRTVAQPTAKKAVEDANAFAERLLAAKTPTDLADDFADQDVKTRAAILAAVDSNVSMYRSQIATLENERDALQASVDLAKDPLRIPVVTRDRLATIREELGIKQRLLAKAEGTKLQTEMMEYASLRAPVVERGTGVSGFDMGASDAIEDFEFSRGAPADGGQTVASLEKALDKVVGDPGVAGKRIKIFQSVSDLFNDPAYKYDYDGADIPADAKAFVNPKNGQAFMFADNIGKGEELGVLLHEIGVHIGFRNLFNKAQYGRLVAAVKGWANRNDNSLESRIAKRAVARVEAAETTAEQYDDELLAYTVEEAIKAGVNPDALQGGSPIRNWLKAVMDVLRNALSKYGINVKTLTTGDLVNMAYGAAQLELRGTWHGSDAAFTAFNTKYAGAGEGAFDLRFEAEKSLGAGPYTTPNKEYAEYYQNAVPFGKAANESGYGLKTYQDYRAMDEKFMTTSNEDLTTAALQSKFESRIVTAYLTGVNDGQSLDPAQNKNAQEMLKRLQTGARTPKEQKAADTLSLQKIKALEAYPPKGNLYRTLDDIPRNRVYSVNSDFTVGERPALDALLQKYGDDWAKRTAKETGSYPANTLFFNMREKLGIKKATELLKASGIDAIEQSNERGKYVERAYIDQAPEILGINLKPVGPATGAGRPGTGKLLFSRGAPADALEELALDITTQPKTLREKLGSNLALQAEMQAVDMRAGLRDALKAGDDTLFTQAMYHVRKAEQKMAQMFTVMNSGPLVAYRDSKGLVGYRSSNQNSAREVFDAISDIPVDDPQKKTNIAQAYLVAQRAQNKGLSKLDLGELGITEEKIKAALAAANADPTLKSALENVRRKYNAYNKGLIEFLAESGRISKKEAARLLKDGDYVPYYRVKDGNATLHFGNNVTFNVGDIRRQPYLAELKGGETKLLPLNEAIQQNTLLLTDMALTNNAAKSVAYGLQALGKGKGEIDPLTGKRKNLMPIKPGFGPDDAKVIRFYQEPDPNKPDDDGKRHIVVETKGTLAEGVPAELVVQSLEGSSLALPGFLKLGGVAADWLRAGVTRTPLYIARKLIREPMAAAFTGGLESNTFSAILKAGAEFVRMSRGTSDAQAKLIEKGLIQSNIFAGDMSDMKKMALQLASGKDQNVMDKVFAAADRYAMRADAATLALVLQNAEANGLSEVEADMMTMESMNFYKRGLSPTLQYASRLIPFFNAQIQGLNVLIKAARGNMPFEEQQEIKRKFFNNALLLTATGIVYAMAMEDDETFRNARPRDKYSNFFLPIPGVDEPLKLPIPFEAGYFYSLAVAAVDAMRAETDGKAQFQALRDLFLGSIPGYSSMGVPQLVKPVAEVWTNKNFLTGGSIEPQRMQNYTTEERYLATTTELAKEMSKAVPILSPIQIEHIVRGYFGVLPLAAVAAANGLFEREGKGEKPEGRASDLPLIGSAFQKKYGGGDSDVVYREAKEAMDAKTTFNKMLKEGRREEAIAFRDENRAELALAAAAGQYRQLVGRINEDVRRTQERNDLNAQEKRIRLDKLEEAKQQAADRFLTLRRKAEAANQR